MKFVVQDLTSGGLLGVWGKWVKHAKYIYNIQDFNPEQVLLKSSHTYVHPDEIEAITREFAAIGNNLNQIAAFFNSGGIQSRAMHENINHAIACIFEMREQVAEMAGKNYGNIKAHRK